MRPKKVCFNHSQVPNSDVKMYLTENSNLKLLDLLQILFTLKYKNLFELNETFSLGVKDPFFFYLGLPFTGPMSIFSIFRRFLNPRKLLIFDT